MRLISLGANWRLHRLPLAALILLPVLANAVALTGIFNTDPTLPLIQLGQGMRQGWFAGSMGWVDLTVGEITEPLGYLVTSDWLNGIVPWWNPYNGIGMPLAAEMQTSAFFLPFVMLLHFNCGWLLLRILLQILSGVFCYWLFIEIGLVRSAAMVGGALYALSPEFGLSPHAAIAPLPFLPLLLLGIEHAAAAAAQGKRMGWSLAAVSVAYSIYAGFPEVAYFDGLLAALWAIWRFASLISRSRAWLRFAVKMGLAAGMGIVLTAPLLLPFLSYVSLGYLGSHGPGLAHIVLGAARMPQQIFPFLYGNLGSPFPATLKSHFDDNSDITRLPGWAELPILALVVAGLWRYGSKQSLKYVMLFWIVLWEARYAGIPIIISALNLVPGIDIADSTRFSGPSVNFAVFCMAALAFNDYHVLVPFTTTRLRMVVITLSFIVLAAFVPAYGLLINYYRLKPDDLWLALAFGGLELSVLVFLCKELIFPRRTRALAGAVILGPLLCLLVPQFAGMRAGHIDMAPVKYLQAHAGTNRIMSLGPFDLNFPARYGIASIDYASLPVPSLWTDYVRTNLYPRADLVIYGNGDRGQMDALSAHLSAYEAIGVRYIVTYPSDNYFWTKPLATVDRGTIYTVHNLTAENPDLTGVIPASLTLPSIAALSVVIGTYGRGDGPIAATICAAGKCVTATADTATAIDDAPIILKFPASLAVPPGARISYQLTHATGLKLAIWMGHSADGSEAPTINLFPPTSGPVPSLVFQDQSALIFELPDPAPYVKTGNTACGTAIIDRQNFRTDCPQATTLTRQEMFFPGWSAEINDRPVAVSQSGLFQSITIPAGMASIKFSYAPPHIKLACLIALISALILFGFAAFETIKPRVSG